MGRDGELHVLDQLLDGVGAGHAAAVIMSGEPGIGKTSLISEVLHRSEARGYRTLSGRAAEFERDLPFAVVVEALERHLSSLDLDLIERDELEVLASVFPSLARAGQRASADARPDERHRLLRALQALLEALAADRPLILALDDLHWSDAASVDLVCRLLHRASARPSLLLLASRPAQTEPRLRSAFVEAERHGYGRRMDLAPLSALEAEELLGTAIEPGLRDALYRQSGGNPLYLEQLAAASERGARVSSGEGGAHDTGVPLPVTAAIRAEVDALLPLARTLLQGASSVGDSFDPDLAAEAAGISEQGALVALDELLASDLIRPSDSPRLFRFRHPIVRHAVYETAGAGWRRAAHGRAAAALEASGAAASARASHVERSARMGDRGAAALLTQAGQETVAHAPASAAHWFDAALRLTPTGDEGLEQRLGLLAQRAAALGNAGRIEQSREALREFLALSPKEPSELRLRAAVLAAILDELLGTQEAGRRLLLDELARLPDQAGPEAAELKRELAFTCFFDADWAAMGDWARRALGADCEGMVKVGALAAVALAEFGRGNLHEAQRSVSDGAELFDSLSDEQIATHHPGIAIWLGWAEVCTERFDDAMRHQERSIAILRTVGQRHLTVAPLAVQGEALALTGRGEELRAVAEAATEAALLSASDLFLSWAMTLRCQASIQAGDLHDAVRSGERAAAAAAQASNPLSGNARVHLASALLEIGEPERAREQLTSVDGRPDLPPFPMYETLCFELLVRAELALGRSDRAEEYARRAEQAAQRLGLRLPLAQARRACAVLLLERGELQRATNAALASSEAAEAADAPVEAARGRILAGRALAAADKRDAAITQLELAHEQLVRGAAFRYSDEAARELRKLGRPVPRNHGGREAGSNALGLTRRELEVTQLVAAGKTNREIAHELFLSVRTVDRHVSRIFDKLGVNSRAAATSVFERARSAPGG